MNDEKKIKIMKQIAKNSNIKFHDIIISPIKTKKFRIYIEKDLYFDFGAKGMDDYLDHQDEARRSRFHNRFKNNKGYNNPNSALFYSKTLLW